MLTKRTEALQGLPEIFLQRCDSDLEFYRIYGDLSWARALVRNTRSEGWSLRLAFFDDRSLGCFPFVS